MWRLSETSPWLAFLVCAVLISPTEAQLQRDPGCGSTKTCFSDCGASSCTYQVACQVSNGQAQCTLSASISDGNMWLGWGVSDNQLMGSATVIGCKKINNVFSAFNSINGPRTSQEYSLESGITLSSSSYTNGVLSCTLSRPLSPGQGSQFDLNQPRYWLLAYGNGNGLSYHGTNRYASSAKYDMTAVPATQAPTSSTLTGSLAKSSECGSSKGCFTKCDSASSCTFTVTWSVDAGGATATYTLRSDVGSGGSYIALGFSDDSNMGSDDVIGCVGLSDGTVTKFSAWNNGKSPEVYTDSTVVLVDSAMTDGTLSCSLRRRLAGYTVAGKTRKNIADPLTLLFARGSGSVENGVVSLSYHGANDRFPSSQPLTASDVLDDSAQDEDYPLIKLHGALMIGAWVFLASIGIVAARYYKPVWKQDMCSLKVWFQIHRTCMVLVFCTCVAGFVVIFLEVEEWVEIEQKPKYLEGHPIMGVVVTGLCVINPLMALIRPHPGTKYRPIFNWAHWFVGTSAHILGVATIFFGFELDKADAPDYLKYILAGYVGWQALVELTLEFLACCCKKRPARSDAYKMSDNGVDGQMEDNDTNQSDGMDSFRKGLFTIHFFVVTAISAVLISLLVVGKKELDS